MKRVLSKSLPSAQQEVGLSKTESHHLLHVLRAKTDDLVEVLDGDGSAVIAKVKVNDSEVTLVFHATSKAESKTTFPIHICAAILKSNAMELVVEKSVELGVKEFTPIIAKHCVPQLNRKGPDFFQNRWQKIADQSLKQCGRLNKMTIHPPRSLDEFISTSTFSKQQPMIICDETSNTASQNLAHYLFNSNSTPLTRATVLIGPEGGWSENEITLFKGQVSSEGVVSVHLGELILRAETAAFYITSLFNSYFSLR